MQSMPIDITHVFQVRLTVSHASENSWSKTAVRACGTPSYFHYKITSVSAETSVHGRISAQRAQYPNSFICTSIFRPFSVYKKTFNKLYDRVLLLFQRCKQIDVMNFF